MQGILKSNHQRLCDCLQDIKVMQPVPDHKLNELEDELHAVFMRYQEKMNELKHLVNKYEEKQRSIKNEMKRVRKHSMVVSKKIDDLMLSRMVI